MTKVSKIYPGSSREQMRHCDPCTMPNVVAEHDVSYSLLKHMFVLGRDCVRDPDETEIIREQQAQEGRGELFDAVMKCVNCAQGLCLLIEGQERWQLGGTPSQDTPYFGPQEQSY